MYTSCFVINGGGGGGGEGNGEKRLHSQTGLAGGKLPLLQFLHIYTPAPSRLASREFAIVQKLEFKYENTEV